jgi:hypothetical protein
VVIGICLLGGAADYLAAVSAIRKMAGKSACRWHTSYAQSLVSKRVINNIDSFLNNIDTTFPRHICLDM